MISIRSRQFHFSILSIAVLLLSAAMAGADSLFETSRETPGYHDPEAWSGKFAFVNDVLGPDTTVEWDDARTAGYELFLRAPFPLYFEAAYSGFTYRSEISAPEDVSRIDSLHFQVGGIWEGPLLGGRGRAMGGLGGLFFGNFIGYQAQTWLHTVMGQDRPIPGEGTYEDPASAVLVSGELGLNLPGGWPLYIDMSVAAALGGSIEYLEWETSAGLLLESPFGAARLGAAWNLNSFGGFLVPLHRYLDDARGLRLEYEFRVHGLFTRYSVNPSGELPQGSIGFAFSGGSRATPGALWNGGYRMDFSFEVGSLGYVTRVAWLPRNWSVGMSSFGIILDFHSGALDGEDPYTRYQKTLAGAEWTLPLNLGHNVVLEPYAGLQGGVVLNKEYQPIDTVYTAVLSDAGWRGLGRLSAGFRLTPIRLLTDGRVRGFGIVAGGILDLEFPSDEPLSAGFHVGLSVSDFPSGSTARNP